FVKSYVEDNSQKDLIIIPHGELWNLNFDLLLTEETTSNNPKDFPYLLKDYNISYANSATLLFQDSFKEKQRTAGNCLAFSYSDSLSLVNDSESSFMSFNTLRKAGDDLPGSRREIAAVAKIIDGNYYFGKEASEKNFKEQAEKYNILHLALHGEIDNQDPNNSKLYFTASKDSIEDDFLYTHELYAMDLPSELTVLSACNTGAGKLAKGEGIMSLGRAFQYAGTKSLMLSSWEVSDGVAPELMKAFYSYLKDGKSKSESLRLAKLGYLQNAPAERSYPYYWGNFFILGDDSSVSLEREKPFTIYLIFGVLIIFFMSGVYYARRKILLKANSRFVEN
ncbi:MAG: CHAT domain-containing protein, partial [Bacteroidota bacterium]